MKADILKLLLHAHAEGDESSFRKAALQLAAAESSAGHVRVADEIRAIIAKMPATSTRKPAEVHASRSGASRPVTTAPGRAPGSRSSTATSCRPASRHTSSTPRSIGPLGGAIASSRTLTR